MRTSSFRARHLCCAMLLLPAAIALTGCDEPAGAGPAPATRPTTGPSTHPGRIGPGDVLSLRVINLSGPGVETIKPVRVAADGTIQPVFLGPIKVAALSDADAEAAIDQAYRAANIVQDAPVIVRRLLLAPAAEAAAGDSIANWDLVRIAVGDLTGPGTEVVVVTRVDGEGVVGLPYVGKQKLAGLTEQRAEKVIEQTYRGQNIVLKAPVSVFRLERAPADAGQVDLPDRPVAPVPEFLKPFCEEGPGTPLLKR
jgi:protein involved in polysaccharide export with SLBB domain